jgi:hypothetical protein
MSNHPDWLPELQELLDRLQDGDFTEPDRLRLNELLRAGADQRDYFVTYMDVHSRLAWEGGQESGQWAVDSGQPGVDSVVEPPNQPREISDPLSFAPPIILDLSDTARCSPSTSLFSAGSFAFSYVAAAMIVGAGLLVGWAWRVSYYQALDESAAWQASPPRMPKVPTVGRITDMIDCQWSDPAVAPADRAAVPLGHRYLLTAGLLEITYDTGTRVILEGPADYEIESASGGLLSLGRLTARVEARGERTANPTLSGHRPEGGREREPTASLAPRPSPLFTVRTPAATITDLGTEFGVEVDRLGASWAHVFRGKVELRPSDRGKDGTHPIRLTEDESARVEVDRGQTVTVVRGTGRPNAFVREMPKRAPLKLHNTGEGLAEGAPDPHWQLVAVSSEPNFKPRPAIVSSLPFGVWLANDPTRSQWISTGDHMPNLPHGVTYTFRTTFALTGMAPDTAVLQGWFIVDNYVRAIRLNGKEVPVPKHADGSNGLFRQFYRFVAGGGFVEGTNVLEMDVYNGHRGPPPNIPASAMALRVELEGSAREKAIALPGGTLRTEKQKEGISLK